MAVYRRFIVQQKYVDGQPTEEYRLGVELDSTNYHSLENCESGSECTELNFRWVDMDLTEGYYCEGTTKHKKQKRQQKCVNEEEWTDIYPYEYRAGEMIEEESTDCGYEPTGEYHLYGNTDGNGALIITPSQTTYSSGDVVTIGNLPIEEYMLSCYNYGNNLEYGTVTSSSVFSLTMSHNWYVSASFKSKEYKVYDLTKEGGKLNITPSKSFYYKNDSITVTNTPDKNYVWSAYQFGYTRDMEFSSKTSTFSVSLLGDFYISGLFNFSLESGYLYYKYSNGDEKYINWSSPWLYGSNNNGSNAAMIIDTSGVVSSFITSFSGFQYLYSVEFPSVVKTYSHCFENCINLTVAKLPSVSNISRYMFAGDYRLSSVELDKCREIGSYAFSGCVALESISLPYCQSIEDEAFYSCTDLKDIYLLSGHLVSFNLWYTFRMCNSNLKIHVPESLCEDYNYTYGSNSVALSGATKYGSELFDCMSVEPVPQEGCLYVEYSDGTSSWFDYSESYISKRVYSTYNARYIKDYCGNITFIDSYAYLNSGTYVSYLECVDFPNVSYICISAFAGCPLKKIYFDNLTEIGNSAFKNNFKLYKAIIPNVKYIYTSAFYECALRNISMPKAELIGAYAFYHCSKLPYVDLPNVKEIYSNAFAECGSVSFINIPKVEYIGNYAFDGCFRTEIVYMNEVSSVPSISGAVFSTTNLQSIVIPCSLFDDFLNHSYWQKYSSYFICPEYYKVIASTDGNGSVYTIPSKESFMRGEKITVSATPSAGYVLQYYQLGTTPTYSSTVLEDYFSLTMTNNWYVSGNFLYHGGLYYLYKDETESWYRNTGTTLTSYSYKGSLASVIIDYQNTIKTITSSAFISCSYLQAISCDSVTSIGSSAFRYCYNLSYVQFGGLQRVYDYAFEYCGISEVVFNNLSYIGYYAFYGCPSLSYISFNNLKNCSRGAFQSCSNLSYAYMGTISYIPSSCFMYCSNLKSIDMPNVTSISDNAFEYCSELESFNGTNIEYIGSCAFKNCSKLRYLDLPNVKSIGTNAFYSCNLLYTISIPKCTYIGTYAFARNYWNLHNIYLDEVSTVPTIFSTTFTECSALEHIYIPCSLFDDFLNHAIWSSFSSLFSCSADYSCNVSYVTYLHEGYVYSRSAQGVINGKRQYYTIWDWSYRNVLIDYNEFTISPSTVVPVCTYVDVIPNESIYTLSSSRFYITKPSTVLSLYLIPRLAYKTTEGNINTYNYIENDVYSYGYIGYSTWSGCGSWWSNTNRIPSNAVDFYTYSYCGYFTSSGLYDDNNLQNLYFGGVYGGAYRSGIVCDLRDAFFSNADKLTNIYIYNSSVEFIGYSYLTTSTNISQGGIFVVSSLYDYYLSTYSSWISDYLKSI